MSLFRAAMLAASVAAGPAGCALPGSLPPAGASSPSALLTVGGSVRLPRGVVALPEGALLRVQLLEVSRTDAPATVLAEQYTGLDGRMLPQPFGLCINASRVDARARYQVSARITDRDGGLLWLSTEAYPVLTHGAADRAEIAVWPAKRRD